MNAWLTAGLFGALAVGARHAQEPSLSLPQCAAANQDFTTPKNEALCTSYMKVTHGLSRLYQGGGLHPPGNQGDGCGLGPGGLLDQARTLGLSPAHCQLRPVPGRRAGSCRTELASGAGEGGVGEALSG